MQYAEGIKFLLESELYLPALQEAVKAGFKKEHCKLLMEYGYTPESPLYGVWCKAVKKLLTSL